MAPQRLAVHCAVTEVVPRVFLCWVNLLYKRHAVCGLVPGQAIARGCPSVCRDIKRKVVVVVVVVSVTSCLGRQFRVSKKTWPNARVELVVAVYVEYKRSPPSQAPPDILVDSVSNTRRNVVLAGRQ